MIITLGDALKELMQQLEQKRKEKPMKQELLFSQKPILEVLKPIRFIDGKWQISKKNENI